MGLLRPEAAAAVFMAAFQIPRLIRPFVRGKIEKWVVAPMYERRVGLFEGDVIPEGLEEVSFEIAMEMSNEEMKEYGISVSVDKDVFLAHPKVKEAMDKQGENPLKGRYKFVRAKEKKDEVPSPSPSDGTASDSV